MRGKLLEGYAPLFRHLNLLPERREQLAALLLDKAMDQSRVVRSLLTGQYPELDRSDPEVIDVLKDTVGDDYDARIRSLLGDADWIAYRAYAPTVVARREVEDFARAQPAGNGHLDEADIDAVASFLGNATSDPATPLNAEQLAEAKNKLSPTQFAALSSAQAFRSAWQTITAANRQAVLSGKVRLVQPTTLQMSGLVE